MPPQEIFDVNALVDQGLCELLLALERATAERDTAIPTLYEPRAPLGTC